MKDKIYELSFALSDGTTKSVQFSVPQSTTPIKGVDYYTVEEQEDLIQHILTELGAIPVFGRVDKNNNIILTAMLNDGRYYLKYMDSDGNLTDICTYDHAYVPAPTYTNLFVAGTCQLNKRTSSSGAESYNCGSFLTDYIDLGDVMSKGGVNTLHYKGMYFHTQNWKGQYEVYSYICYYDENKNFIKNVGYQNVADVVADNGDYVKVLDSSCTNARYIRVTACILPNPSAANTVPTELTSISQLDGCVITLNENINDSGSNSGGNSSNSGGNSGNSGGTSGKTYTNQIPISKDYDGTVFNSVGYQVGKRISSSGTGLSDVSEAASASNPVFVTGFIPCRVGDVIRFKNCYMATTEKATDVAVYGQSISSFRLQIVSENFVNNTYPTWTELLTNDWISCETDGDGNVIGFTSIKAGYYVRLVLAGDPKTAIVTVNEEIID